VVTLDSIERRVNALFVSTPRASFVVFPSATPPMLEERTTSFVAAALLFRVTERFVIAGGGWNR
jgi:hypothetical protein